MTELEAAEQAMKQKAAELAAHQQQEMHTLEIKQKEMNVNVEVAKKAVEELKRKHAQELTNLDKNKADLERLRAEAEQARQLELKHVNERELLEKRIRELDQKAAQEHQQANALAGQHQNLQGEIEAQKGRILQNEKALKDREQIVKSVLTEKQQVEYYATERIRNEELARQKAAALAGKTEKERRDAQKEVERLTGEQAEAEKKLYDLQKTTTVKVEEKPATVDVYSHQRYETSEPVVTEVETHKSEHSEDKSLGSKIVDGVKNLF